MAKDPVKADIENRFTFHPATKVTGPLHDAVRADLRRQALKFHKTLPNGRHKSLALTALEEAMHWANAAIACGGDEALAAAIPVRSGATKPPATGGTSPAKAAAAKKAPAAKKPSTPTAPAPAKAAPAKKASAKKAAAKPVEELATVTAISKASKKVAAPAASAPAPSSGRRVPSRPE